MEFDIDTYFKLKTADFKLTIQDVRPYILNKIIKKGENYYKIIDNGKGGIYYLLVDKSYVNFRKEHAQQKKVSCT